MTVYFTHGIWPKGSNDASVQFVLFLRKCQICSLQCKNVKNVHRVSLKKLWQVTPCIGWRIKTSSCLKKLKHLLYFYRHIFILIAKKLKHGNWCGFDMCLSMGATSPDYKLCEFSLLKNILKTVEENSENGWRGPDQKRKMSKVTTHSWKLHFIKIVTVFEKFFYIFAGLKKSKPNFLRKMPVISNHG